MKIYSMTATFGKLEHETLTLKPGLNVIEAPNEWGKSTWCAFLVSMLYGIDTRAKTTKTALADKERYAPWSGVPMAGRMDIQWNGKDITIERRTRGRLIFGEFSAYETATGLEIPELTAENCGTMLLGVERSVFTRAGFLKLTDLPVTQDDALRRRLNDLVTTGDESGSGDKLQKALKDLKNKCRYNRSGLLPQAEAQRDQLEAQLQELNTLQNEIQRLSALQKEKESALALLENHMTALKYVAAQDDAQKVSEAEQAAQDAKTVADGLQANCQGLPSKEECAQAAQAGQALQKQWLSLQLEEKACPPLPVQPPVPSQYQNLSPEDALTLAQKDFDTQLTLENNRKKRNRLSLIFSIISVVLAAGCVTAGAVLTMPVLYIAGAGILLITLLAVLITSVAKTARFRKEMDDLYSRHVGISPDKWVADAQAYADTQAAYTALLAAVQAQRGDLDRRLQAISQEIAVFTKDGALDENLEQWQQACAAWDALDEANRELNQAEKHAQTLRSMVKTAEAPKQPDSLTYSEEQTSTLISTEAFELRQLQLKLGQYQGRAEALGQEAILRNQLKSVNRRIQKLEDTYAALEVAQNALSAATAELQRRFAPRISKRAQELFTKLTGGRYDRLTLREDLSLNISAQDEDTLRSSQWRSDGTVDQLYLALRLAVSEELTPEAPLILDDALVRFDDGRLDSAMNILSETAQNKQVLLFTCQNREAKWIGE